MNSANNYQQKLAIRMNNEGVRRITSGEIPQAIKNLTFALNMCKESMGYESNFETEHCTMSLDQIMERSEAMYSPDNLRTKKCYLYHQAIYIPVEVSYEYHLNLPVSTIIIFNLALAQQLAETHSNRECNPLIKAARLYNLAFNMQREELRGDNIYFTLATVNNLGVIYRQLGDETAANNCFEQLLSILMLVLDYGESSRCLEVFIYNATSTMSKNGNAAAA